MALDMLRLNDHDADVLSLLSFFTDTSYDTAMKVWLGENFLQGLFQSLLKRSIDGRSDVGLHKVTMDIFKNCCALMEPNQVLLANLMLQELKQAETFTPFLSRMTAFLLVLNDTVPVVIGQDSDAFLVCLDISLGLT